MEDGFVIRDRREKGYCMVDNEFIDKYIKILSAPAFKVYFAICRHANNEETSWPSYKMFKEKFGLSETSISKALRELENGGFVKIIRKKDEETHRQQSNNYVLLHRTAWLKPEEILKSRLQEMESDSRLSEQTGGTLSKMTGGTLSKMTVEGTNKKELIEGIIADANPERIQQAPKSQKKISKERGPAFPEAWYQKVEVAYRFAKKQIVQNDDKSFTERFKLTSLEIGQLRRFVKQAFSAGYTVAQIMEFLAYLGDDSYWSQEAWGPTIIPRKLGDFVEGRMERQSRKFRSIAV